MTLHLPFLTPTACGLYDHSSSSAVLCVPWTQANVIAITVVRKTFLLIWLSSAPLRIFACEPLAQWSQTELGCCISPLLSLLCTLAGRGSPWTGATLSVLRWWQRHLYHTVQVRSATEAGPRIRAFRHLRHCITHWQEQPCIWDQQLAVELWQAPASSWRPLGLKNRKDDQQTVQVWNNPAHLEESHGQQDCCWRDMTIIYLDYTWHLSLLSKTCFFSGGVMSPASVVICTCQFWGVVAVSSFLVQ